MIKDATKDNGLMTICMEKEHIIGQMEISMKVYSIMSSQKIMENINTINILY